MTICELLLPEFDREMKSTRQILECVPEEKFTWQPHEKSMTLGRLASHVAEIPAWGAETINRDAMDIAPGQKPFNVSTRAELLEVFDRAAAASHTAIAGATDEHLLKTWSLTFGGKPFLSMPRKDVLRSVVMNHLVHHRAQLGVYLRLVDVAIPGLYGPSADDKIAAAAAKA